MEEVAKILVLGVCVALFIGLVNRGPAGAEAWLRAKFLGQVGQ